ncbi:hypothetical protein SD81_025425 [Tolypothrix campylonemoides VB511288]|nr:hypothetical protein SD81_025425 [Tolypothrix campylonemoides VB511288]
MWFGTRVVRIRWRSLYLNRFIIGLMKLIVALWNRNYQDKRAIALPVNFTIGLVKHKVALWNRNYQDKRAIASPLMYLG